MRQHIPEWSKEAPPIYAIEKSYLENAEQGPFFQGDLPGRNFPPKEKWVDFLGFKVASRIGVPAGPLLNSRWVSFAAGMGYDILTYKTVRSSAFSGHAPPNVVYVDAPRQIDSSIKSLKRKSEGPSSLHELSITNSFGMPSRSPEYLIKDIPLAEKSLATGQILVVSIVGTPSKESEDGYFTDFVRTAQLAKECGAKVVEANFSCPNVSKEEGCLYTNMQAVFDLSKQLTRALNGVPLILKVGLLPNRQMLYNLLYNAAKAGVAAVSGINSVSMPVTDNQGLPSLGPGRLTSGICGSSIREKALEFVRLAREINDDEKLGLTLIGVGGVVLPEHFDQFFEAGADIVQTATGMMWDPYLALRYEASKGVLCTSKTLS